MIFAQAANPLTHALFWRWYEDFRKNDPRLNPSPKGLQILKDAYGTGIEHGIKPEEMDYYMRNIMMRFDNEKAKL
jgi:hypothetical protein